MSALYFDSNCPASEHHFSLSPELMDVNRFCPTFLAAFHATIHSYNWATYIESNNAWAFFYVEGVPKACDGSSERVAIGATHPSYTAALSIAIAAQASGKSVEIIYNEKCGVNTVSWDFVVISIISE